MATSVVSQELDSSMLEGLKLLHSKDPDSLEQLRLLWKQAVKEKYGLEREPVSVLNKINIPTGLKREAGHESNDDFQLETKKSKLEAPSIFHKSAPASPQGGAAPSSVFNYTAHDVEIHGSSSEIDSDDESPLEILNPDGVCMKCKGSTSSTNNKLVECVDCHKHYHQQCHFPPITDMDLSDPRFVWYCSSCEENITTTTSSDKNKISSSSSVSAGKSSLASSKSVSSSSVTKSSRSYGSSHSSKSGVSPSSSSGSSSKLSTNSSPKHSSGSSHLMKKRSMKKHDKKKSK